MLSVFPFVKQIGLIMRSKIKYYKMLAKMALQVIIWDFGDIIRYFYVFLQNVFICYYCLFSSFSR